MYSDYRAQKLKEGTMKTEKRSHPRFQINELVEIDYGHEQYISAEGINLSKNGVLCKTQDECPLYSKIFMMMTLPYKKKSRIIDFEGVVIRSKHTRGGWETGINITSMKPASRAIFDEVMHHFHV